MNVHVIPDRALRDARTNLDLLIERARRSPVFGDVIEFDAPAWDLAPLKPVRPTANSGQQAKLYFTTHDGGTTRGIDGRTVMARQFSDFLKTLVVLREESRPRITKDHGRILRAARSLYDSMGGPDHDPVNLVSADFLAACNDIRTRKTLRGKPTEPTTAYRLGMGLEEIAEFVNRHNVSKARIAFVNPFPRVTYDHTKVDDEARDERAKKMTSMEEMGAIIDLSLAVRGDPAHERDMLCMAAVELLTCGPVRINELLYIKADCRRSDRKRKKGSGEEVEYLGYAYEGSKEAPDSTKWIPSVMAEIADRALADIRRITEPYREAARWMEDHPGRAFVAEAWRLADPDTMLLAKDVASVLGLGSNSSANYWLNRHGVQRHTRGSDCLYRLGDVEAEIIRMQPQLPPAGGKLSDRMFLIPTHFFKDRTTPQLHTLDFLDDQHIGDFLGGRPVVESGFKRYGVLDAEGKPYRIRSHGPRHFLNTSAQEGLLSQLDIARWSGRKDVGQNAAYDHSGGLQLGRAMRKVLETAAMKGPIVATVERLPPVDREAFLQSRFATAHFTSIGACVQDFSLAPCPSHGSCAGCSEHLVVKGKTEHLAEAERLLDEHQTMLDGARVEMEDGTYNASVWVQHNEKVVDGLKRTIAVHADATIPDGTVVQIE